MNTASAEEDTGHRWAQFLVAASALLLAMTGAAAYALSLRPARLFNVLVRAAAFITAQTPGFLTIAWVEARMPPLAVALLVLGLLLIVFRRRATTVVTPAVTGLVRSAREWRHRLPTQAAAALRATGKLEIAALAAIVGIGVALRVMFLNEPMRYDEAFTYRYFVSQPFQVGLSIYPVANNHVLHTVLSHVSVLAFGADRWAIRFPAFVAGAGIVPVSYAIGRAIYGRAAALVGTALVAGSSALIEYSANARGYSLVVVAFLLLLATARPLARTGDPILWVVFAIIAALGMFAVPTMAYAIATVSVWLTAEALLQRPRPNVRVLFGLAGALAGAVALTLVLYLPVILVGTSGLLQTPENPADVRSMIEDVRVQWTRDLPVPSFVAAAALIGLVFHWRCARVRVPPLAAAVPVVLVAVLAAGRSMPYARVWLYLLPLFLLSAGAGLAWALRAMASVLGGRRPFHELSAVAIAVAVAFTVMTDPAIRRENEGQDGPAIALWLQERLSDDGGQVVSVTPHNLVLLHAFEELELSPGHLVSSVDPAADGPVFVVLPGGKSLEMLTGDVAYPPGEGAPFEPVPGLKEALGPTPRLVKTFATARIFSST